jgi:hypothetical protein
MDKWILLPEGLFLFGPGGVTRVEETFDWINGEKTAIGVQLFNERKHIATSSTSLSRVKELIEELHGY